MVDTQAQQAKKFKNEQCEKAYTESVQLLRGIDYNCLYELCTIRVPTEPTINFCEQLGQILENKKKAGDYESFKKNRLNNPRKLLHDLMALFEYEKLPSTQVAKIEAFATTIDLEFYAKKNITIKALATYMKGLGEYISLDKQAPVDVAQLQQEINAENQEITV